MGLRVQANSMLARIRRAVVYGFSGLAGLMFLVAAYYWFQYWTIQQGPYYMSRAFTWMLFGALFLGVVYVVERVSGQTTNPSE